MMAGLMLDFLNHIHFKKYAYIFIKFIPEFIIIGFTFGYVCLMIVDKWCIDGSQSATPAPDLIKTMTDFFLHPFEAGSSPTPLYRGRLGVQLTLLISAGIAIPLLLIPTPIYEYYQNKKKEKSRLGDKVHLI